AKVEDNMFVASFIVDTGGSVKDVQIVKPVGVGMDDAIAEKISGWKFSPALSGADAIEVLMYARVSVKLPQKRNAVPFRGLPCPIDTMTNC
ncbi:MAG TPA: energy transducer TonB, partial [Terriglobales bacterium]|nr:energy transducer TonB [Terriglobales bacterium]